MQCKELLIEMEKPGTMDHIAVAKRSIFKGKDANQLRNKKNKLLMKKKLYLSADATKISVATVDDLPTGAEPST